MKSFAVLAGVLLLDGAVAGWGFSLSAQEARQIAKEAYIYGFPVVMNYETLHKQALDTTGHDYRAPFNTIASLANVATPDDKFVVTPNSDTPYSFLCWTVRRAYRRHHAQGRGKPLLLGPTD